MTAPDARRNAGAAEGAPGVLPTLRAPSLERALDAGVLSALTTDTLARYLAKQRWYGAKAGRPRDARIARVARLDWPGGPFAIAVVHVTDASGKNAAYQLPLAIRADDVPTTGASTASPSAARRRPEAIARVDAPDGSGSLVDAVESPAFLRGVLAAIARGSAMAADTPTTHASPDATETTLRVERIGDAAGLTADLPMRVGSAEQSNTSLIAGDRAIIKLFRKLEHGEQPDVELTRALTTDASYTHTPALLGVLTLVDGDGAIVSGMAQRFLADSSDAWAYALERGRPYFAAPQRGAAGGPRASAAQTGGAEPENAFLGDAGELGRVTRAMHGALARARGDALAPQPVSAAQIAGWADAARQQVRDGLALLGRQLARRAIPPERVAEAEALTRRRAHYEESIDEIVADLHGDAGMAIRTHGDYHLGQVLRTGDGAFMIIDFEGEPARPLADRRGRTSALRDVAGMLRSFAYAAATLGADATGLDSATREIRIGRWERDVREAFLDGYLTMPGGAFLPSDDGHTHALLRLFETEKAFYELIYELNNRPSWIWIPMRGIAKLMTNAR